jgi:hypothetical protein
MDVVKLTFSLFIAVGLISTQAQAACSGICTFGANGNGAKPWADNKNWSGSCSSFPNSAGESGVIADSGNATALSASYTLDCVEITAGDLNVNSAVTLTIEQDYFKDTGAGAINTGSNLSVSMTGSAAQTFDLDDAINSLDVSNTGTAVVTVSGSFGTLTSLTFGSSGEATFTVDATVTNAITIPSGAVLIVQSGTFTATGGITVNGTLQIDSGATVVSTGNFVAGSGGTTTVNGTLTINGDTTVTGTLDNNATLNVNGGLTVNSGATFTGFSLTSVSSGDTVTWGPAYTVAASETLTIGGTFVAQGGLTVANTGTLNIDSGGTVKIGSGQTFQVATGGTLDLDGAAGSTIGDTSNLAQVTSESGTFTMDMDGSIDSNFGYFQFMDANGLDISNGTITRLNNTVFDNIHASGDAITLGAGTTVTAVILDMNEFKGSVGNNFDVNNYTGSEIKVTGLGTRAGATNSDPNPPTNKLSWNHAWEFQVDTSCQDGTSGSGSFTPSGAGATFDNSCAACGCTRTTNRFTTLTFEYDSGTVPHSEYHIADPGEDSASAGAANADYQIYAVHTGALMVAPPINSDEYLPTFSVTPGCPSEAKSTNWIFVQWDKDEAAVDFVGEYIMGASDIAATTGASTMDIALDVEGSVWWDGTWTVPNNACEGGVMTNNGAGESAAVTTYNTKGAGYYRANTGRATFFLPQQSIDLENDLGDPLSAGVTYQAITFESKDATYNYDNTKDSNVSLGIVTPNSGGTVFTFRPFQDLVISNDDVWEDAENNTTNWWQYRITITANGTGNLRPGMLVGTVVREYYNGSGTTTDGPSKIACIADNDTTEGARVICSGIKPGTESGTGDGTWIPFNITFVNPQAAAGGGTAGDFTVATWRDSSDTINHVGTFGSKGTPHANNQPPGTRRSTNWSIGDKFYMFGGSAFISTSGETDTLWEYDVSSGNWTWLAGSNDNDAPPVYGGGTPSSANTPGHRVYATGWVYNGDLYLFGGRNQVDSEYYGDLWRWDVADGTWTHEHGIETGTAYYGTYGTQGTPNGSTNQPGSRYGAVSWITSGDPIGDGEQSYAYLFGGRPGATSEEFGDLWRLEMDTLYWTFIDGSSSADILGTYGTEGSYNANNRPGARLHSLAIADDQPSGADYLYLFGASAGCGESACATSRMSDLWVYDTDNEYWAWISGPKAAGEAGTYGTQGTPATTNRPGGRGYATGWLEATGDLLIFGGNAHGEDGVAGTINDLWRYTVSGDDADKWTWIRGSKTRNELGTYSDATTSNNWPGARDQMGMGMIDASGRYWLWGGNGYDESATGRLPDLWQLSQ